MMYTTPQGEYDSFCRDMLSATHLLIAGSTGSGKSTLLNRIIWTALCDFPSERQFIFIDLKRVELSQYKDLPHTLKYADTLEKSASALAYALKLMDDRYYYAQKYHIKNVTGIYPDVYIVIDELADLILQDYDKSFTKALTRLATQGRASAIHLLLCTQQANRKILSAPIISNCTERIALRCFDGIESRQIIGTDDAVNLPLGTLILRSSEGLFSTNFEQTPQEEIDQRVNHWLAQCPKSPE